MSRLCSGRRCERHADRATCGLVTSAPWPPRRGGQRPNAALHGPDLDALTGLRSGKPSYYPEYRVSAERLRRVIVALDRISAALVRTMEGSEALVRAVVDAAADHLSADWVAFALLDGELPDSRPRHLVLGPDRVEWPSLELVPADVYRHVRQVCAGHAVDDGSDHDPETARRHRHIPIRLDGRTVGGFIAWTPQEREIDDTDQSVLRILAGQTAAALQNCALLDRSERLYARAARQADDLKQRNAELERTQQELGAARQREVLDSERHRIARELHDSVTQYVLSAGMHIELCRSEIDDPRLRSQLDTAKDLTRRAVEQLRSAIYALNDDGCADKDLPAMLRRLSTVHMPDELRVEVRIGGKPVALPTDTEQSLFRIAGEALFNTAVHAGAERAVVRLAYRCGQVRLTVSDDGRGSPEEVRRSLRAANLAGPSGEHRGLVNMQARAREMGGTLTFRRARLGGLQVQVEIPVPGPELPEGARP
ncbi:GAF domain-containing sensor histidine kinase [Pseudonocardia sp. K10HN5]|uniref:histidine kinase n=1 Tax=Pseudonocardia acidicola TaxID=2724939 RepID=A0ABX1SK74_9PSEU|nr:GAF domain-containing sensor histidine kinase [Pseudonocardia acidicola]